MMHSVAAGCGLFVSVVFVLSCFEKGRALVLGTARWHPVMLRLVFVRGLAREMFAASAGCDLLTPVLLATAPLWGGLLALCLVGIYSLAGFAVVRSGGRRCECMPGPLDASSRGAFIARNAIVACAAAVVVVAGGVETSVSVPGVAVGGMLCVTLFAVTWLLRSVPENGTEERALAGTRRLGRQASAGDRGG